MTVQAMETLALTEREQREGDVLECMEAFRSWRFATRMALTEPTRWWKGEALRTYQDFMSFRGSIREEAELRVHRQQGAAVS